MNSMTYFKNLNNLNDYNMLYEFFKNGKFLFPFLFPKFIELFQYFKTKKAKKEFRIDLRDLERFCPKVWPRFGTYVAKRFYPKMWHQCHLLRG